MTSQIKENLKAGLSGAAETMIAGAAKNLGQLLNVPVEFTLVQIAADDSVVPEAIENGVVLSVEFIGGLDGESWFSLAAEDAEAIVKLMTAGMQIDDEDLLGELGMSALSEAMNQLMAGSATSLSDELGDRIDISPPVIQRGAEVPSASRTNTVVVTYEMAIADKASSRVHWQIDCDLAEDLAARWMAARGEPQTEEAPPVPDPSPIPQQQTMSAAPQIRTGVIDTVELDVAVELGSVCLTIGELLRLKEGSVVALAQAVGDHVAMLVNGTPIASGDVVVVDGTLGFRVSDLISGAKGA